MSNGHTRHLPQSSKRVCLVAAAALIGSLVLSAQPGSAEPGGGPAADRGKPTITEIQSRIDTLNHQAEIASEELNTVRVQMKAARQRLTAIQTDVARKRHRVEQLRALVVGTALSDYQNAGGLSTSTSLLVADNPSSFMDGVASKAMVEFQQTALLTQLSQRQRQLSSQEKQAASELAAIKKGQAEAAQHKAELARRTKQAQDILDTLQAAQLARLQQLQSTPQPSRSAVRVAVSDVPASERAKVAVQTALDQLGDPYVYGASGPDSFDCSGLTMYAWSAAGVALSHSSSVQSAQGTPVSISSLMPGDLVFYYSPVSHVGMYIGNGQVVHAPHTGSYVEVVPLNSMPINHAQRVG